MFLTEKIKETGVFNKLINRSLSTCKAQFTLKNKTQFTLKN